MRAAETLKTAVLRLPGLERAWSAYRRLSFHRQYEVRRERYASLCREKGLVYREAAQVQAIRARLSGRGYAVTPRPQGEVHTFAFIPRIGWHPALYNDLQALGPVTEFDYAALGYGPEEFYRLDSTGARRRREMNDLVLPAIREAHRRRAVDWLFVYASGLEVTRDLVQRIVDETGVPVVNMCLDDKQSWEGPSLGGQRIGQIDIAAAFDVSWTSARIACEWYMAEGARPIYMPEGFDASTYHPIDVVRDIPVSFIGAAYGFRPRAIRYLRRHGVRIETFGPGWGTRSVWGDEQVRVINRSAINLGMGGIGYSESLTNVKTRDFEIAGTGGGVYLTSFNPDLAQHFDIGREILCYRHRDEMLELIRYYLAHADEAREIARRGQERSLREHRWLHRYMKVCRILGILAEDTHRPSGDDTNARPHA